MQTLTAKGTTMQAVARVLLPLLLLPSACSPGRVAGVGPSWVRLDIRFPGSASGPASSSIHRPTGAAATVDSVRVSVYGDNAGSGAGGVLLAREVIPVGTSQSEVEVRLRLPAADRYHIVVEGHGQRRRAGRIDSTSYGVQYLGTTQVETILSSHRIRIDMVDAVPLPLIGSAVTGGDTLLWAPIRGAVSYRLRDSQGRVDTTVFVSGLSFPFEGLTYRVRADFPGRVAGAFSEPVEHPVEGGPYLSEIFPDRAFAGGSTFTLSATGYWNQDAALRWNDVNLPATDDGKFLTAEVPASLIARPGSAEVRIVDPDGQMSGALPFMILSSGLPPPTIRTLTPDSATAGLPGFDLIVDGAGFQPGAVLSWNEERLGTSYLGAGRLRSHVFSSRIASAGTATVRVTNPDSKTSNAVGFTIIPNPWTRKAPLPTARRDLAAVTVGGTIYAVSGLIEPQSTGAMEAYDPASDTWVPRSPLPNSRSGLGAVAVGTTVYAVGGTPGVRREPFADTLQAFDSTTNTWIRRAPMPTPRGQLAAGVIQGSLYCAGGISTVQAGPATVFRVLEVHDPTTNAWSTRAAMPSPRAGVASAVVNGILYVIGGFESIPTTGASGTMEAYDPASNRWTARASMPTPRQRFAAGVVNGIIYAVGGARFSPSFAVLDVVEAYDPATDTWTPKTPLPARREWHAVSAANGILYVMGGSDGVTAQLSTVFAYDPSMDLLPPPASSTSMGNRERLPRASLPARPAADASLRTARVHAQRTPLHER